MSQVQNRSGYQHRYQREVLILDALGILNVSWIIPDKRVLDLRHSLTDLSAWGIYNANGLYKDYSRRIANSPNKPLRLHKIRSTIYSAQLELSESVSGNHFFFVGKSGAEETSRSIEKLVEKVKQFREKWEDL